MLFGSSIACVISLSSYERTCSQTVSGSDRCDVKCISQAVETILSTQTVKDRRELEMPKIILSDEDAEHIKDWQRLSYDEKEAITKIAKLLGNEDRRKSFYTLLENQIKISELLTTAQHIGWAGRMFMKAGAVAGVLLAVIALGKNFIWK